METNLDQLENSVVVLLAQIQAVKAASSEDMAQLKAQLVDQQVELKDLNKQYIVVLGKFEEASCTIVELETEKNRLSETVNCLQLENQEQAKTIALLKLDNEEMFTKGHKLMEELKRITEYSAGSNNSFQKSNNEIDSILEHIQAQVNQWKSGQEELERTRKLMSEIGKYWQNNLASSSSSSTSNNGLGVQQAKIEQETLEGLKPEAKPDIPSSSAEKSLPNETSSGSVSSPPSYHPSDSLERSVISGKVNVRNRKQLTPYVKSRKCHGRVKDSSQYRCLCGFTYKSRIGLHVHVRKMTQRWEHNCNSCGQYFFYASELQKHWNTSNCSKNFNKSQSSWNRGDAAEDLSLKRKQLLLQSNKYAIPRLKALQKPKYKTTLWSQRAFTGTRTPFRARKASSGHSVNWKFNCKICHSRFQYLAYLKKHMAGTHNDPDYLNEYVRGCQLCGDMFQTNQKYWKHRANVHNLKRKSTDKPVLTPKNESSEYESNEDTEKPPVLISMSAHSSSTKELVVPTKRIMIERYLKDQAQHLKTIHAPVEPTSAESNGSDDSNHQHKCHCGKVYMSRTALMHHVKSMKYGMIFKCLRCSRGFTQLVNLQSHMSAMHHEDCREFACGSCDKIFWKRKDFRLHCQAEHDTNCN